MATIYDVAHRAGVSPATVSRVFNGSNVRPHLAQAVRDAAIDLAYVPNSNARRLRLQRSELITLMVPDIENPFFTSMTRAVEDVARAAGFSVLLCNTDDDPDKFAEYLRAVVSEPVAGILVVPPSPDVVLDIAMERSVPVVCVDRSAPRYALDSVVVDNVAGARAAVADLFAAGHRRIACITGPSSVETAALRQQGWEQAVRAHTGAEPDRRLVRNVDYTVRGGEEAATALLGMGDPPDAILAANNKLAAGVVRVMFERQLSPAELGLASLGGLPFVAWQPRGTRVWHLPARGLGSEAARILIRRINGDDAEVQHLVLPTVQTDHEDGYAEPQR
ncbi:LacI family DNA-binding transcriptional regulator [Mariniluteicoccus flavus]